MKARGVYVYGVWLSARGRWAKTPGFTACKTLAQNNADNFLSFLKAKCRRVYIAPPAASGNEGESREF